MVYTDFKQKWLGRSVDYDKVYRMQCVDLTLQYINECYGISSAYGNAVDWWTSTDPKLLPHFDRMQTTDCQQGDIVVLRTLHHDDYTGDGHIGICDASDAANVWLLEQNGMGGGDGVGRNAIGVWRAISKTRIAGVLRPKPIAQVPLYTIQQITPLQIKVRPGHNKWNLGHGTFADVAGNPIEQSANDTHFTAVAILHHREIPQYNYYLEDANTPHGWNVLDCEGYTPPVVIPAPPSAPIPFPGNGEKYHVIVPLQGYQSGTQAGNHSGLATVIEPGEYSIYRYYPGRTDLINITRDSSRAGWWINAADNHEPIPEPPPVPKPSKWVGPRDAIPVAVEPEPVVEPTPEEPWKATYSSFNPHNRKPIRYVLMHDYVIHDYAESGKDATLKKYGEVKIYGMFVKDEVTYGRLKRADDVHWKFWYGIPLKNHDGTDPGIIELEQQLYNPETTVAERKVLRTTSGRDLRIMAVAAIEDIYEDTIKRIDGIFVRKKRNNKNKGTK